MTTDTVPDKWPVTKLIATLREHRADLARRYHIDGLGVFGSYARNEQRANSDLDVLVSFAVTPSLFTLVDLQDELSAILGVPVDLALKASLRPRIGERILHEVIEL